MHGAKVCGQEWKLKYSIPETISLKTILLRNLKQKFGVITWVTGTTAASVPQMVVFLLRLNGRSSMLNYPLLHSQNFLSKMCQVLLTKSYWLLAHKILLHWSSENQRKACTGRRDCNRQKTCQTLYDGNEYLSSLSEAHSFKTRKEQFKISVSAEKSKNWPTKSGMVNWHHLY